MCYYKIYIKKCLRGERLMDDMRGNNKGFSLVELIVVVLIMAIVAVALAPQVMKWVENSRIASDLQTQGDLENACKLAMTDEDAFAAVANGGYEIIITKGDSTGGETVAVCSNIDGSDIDTDPFFSKFFELNGYDDYTSFKNSIELKCNPVTSPDIVMTVYVYEGGHTFSHLEGYSSDVFDNT